MKPMTVIFYDGSALLLSNVRRDKNGFITSGFVENGFWKLKVIGNRFYAYDHAYEKRLLKNEWVVFRVQEVAIPLEIKGDYNVLIEYARDEVAAGRFTDWIITQ